MFLRRQSFRASQRAGRTFAGLLGCVLLVAFRPAAAQELVHQHHPLSAYLDLRQVSVDAPAQTTPSWVESVDYIGAVAPSFTPEIPTDRASPMSRMGRSIFRVRLRAPESSGSDSLQARVFFQDYAGADRPTVSAWNELGERVVAPVPLGQNLGLPSSETLTLSMKGADYLEIEADGDGSQIRGVFLSWLELAEVLQPSDFPSRERVRQPFQILSAARRRKDDAYLYGTVTASLLAGGNPLVLRPTEPAPAPLEFQLERQPLVAVLTCEVLGASMDAPPSVTVNGHPEGNLSFFLPDLADPGYQGISREADKRLGFRYTGWLHAQCVVPGERLAAGLNKLDLGLSNISDAVAIRSVSIQLKYNWEKLDYVLAPAPAAP